MALQNISLDKVTIPELNPIASSYRGEMDEWLPAAEPCSTGQSPVKYEEIWRLLASTPDCERYRVALIPFSHAFGTPHSAPRAIDSPMILLPLTTRDISPLVWGENFGGHGGPEIDEARFGNVRIDFYHMQATRGGRTVYVTALEFKLLRFLAMNPERPISRAELLDRVWGYSNYPTTRTVDNRMLVLRKKFEADPDRPIHFLTIYGVGYKFVP